MDLGTNLAAELDAIVNSNSVEPLNPSIQAEKGVSSFLSSQVGGEVDFKSNVMEEKKERLEKVLEENRAIRNGLDSAKKKALGVQDSLTQIENGLQRSAELAKKAADIDVSASHRKSLDVELSEVSKGMSRELQALQVKRLEIETNGDQKPLPLETISSGASSGKELGVENRRANSAQSASESQQAFEKAAKNIQKQLAVSGGLVSHLESQLASLDDAIVSGTKALSKFTDGDLLMKASSHSQLDEELHTSILVQREALQQNRWVGRALDQLQ
jgi:hypothetical protein